MINQWLFKQIEDLHHKFWDRGGLNGYTKIKFHQDAQQIFVVFTGTKYTQCARHPVEAYYGEYGIPT